MLARPSFRKRLLYCLHRMKLLSFDDERSLGIRLLRIADLIKNWRIAQKIVPLFPTMWRLLLGKNYHTLHLNQPVKMQVLPTNLISLIYLWGKLPCKKVEPEQNVIIWELAPGCVVKSLTNEGTELSVLVELIIRRDYGTNYQGLKVLDVGGYYGESTIFFVSAGAQSVVCVEPYPLALRRISENLRLSGMEDRIKVIPAAIGAERGEGVLIVSKTDPMGNTLQGVGCSDALANYSSSIKIPVVTFEDVLRETGWEEVDVAKLDCEGCEYAIFSSTSDEILRRVKVWIIEFHDGVEGILRHLRRLGYQVEYYERPNGSGLVWAWFAGAALPWITQN